MEHMSFRWMLRFFNRHSTPDDVSQFRTGFTANDFDKIAKVEEKIDPYHRGRVRYQGTYWYAMLNGNVAVCPGERVLVIGREEMTLIVRPFEALHSSQLSQFQEPYDVQEEKSSESVSAPHLRLVKSNLASDKGA